MPFWNKTSTTLSNDVMYVNNTYKSTTGSNALTTITDTNKTGFTPVSTTSTNPILQNTQYAVQTDGKITYKYTDPAGGSRQFNSLQEMANAGIPGYNSATTDQIKNSMQSNLSAAATKANIGSPTATAAESPTAAGTTPTSGGATTPVAGSTPFAYNPETDSVGSRLNNYPDKILMYPEKRSLASDYIHFQIQKYKKSGLEAPENTSTVGTKSNVALVGMEYRKSETLANIFLPIQSGIVDSMSVDWGGGELNPITAAFASVAYSQISSAGSGDIGQYFNTAVTGIKGLGAKFSNASPELRKLLINYFTQEAVGSQGLLSRTIGGALNNNLELLFNGPMLRSFTFNFKLTPRNKTEAELIRKIIRYFKKSMAPALSQSQLFLLAPNIFKIKYVYTGKGDKTEDHPYLNRIKVAALRDFAVNYAPDGNYMTYAENGSMTQYDLSMTFGEIDPIYENDYEQGEGLDGMGW